MKYANLSPTGIVLSRSLLRDPARNLLAFAALVFLATVRSCPPDSSCGSFTSCSDARASQSRGHTSLQSQWEVPLAPGCVRSHHSFYDPVENCFLCCGGWPLLPASFPPPLTPHNPTLRRFP